MTGASNLPSTERERIAYDQRSSKPGSGGESWKRDSYSDEGSRSYQPGVREEVKAASAASGSGDQGEPNADDLIFNFRQALRRHAFSENEKALEVDESRKKGMPSADSFDTDEEATAQKFERLKAARQKIEEQRKSNQGQAPSFATEFKAEKSPRGNRDNTYQVQHQDPYQGNYQEPYRGGYQEPQQFYQYEEPKQKQSSKLARQKMVSDELRAKYMINREPENSSKDSVGDYNSNSLKRKSSDKKKHHGSEQWSSEPSEETVGNYSSDSLNRKRSSRKERCQDNSQQWSDDRYDTSKSSGDRVRFKEDLETIPTREEMLLGSTKHVPKSAVVAKNTEFVDHSSPFASVYKPPAPSATSSYQNSSKNIEENNLQKSQNDKNDYSCYDVEPEIIEPRSSDRADRRRKKYTKAKSLELGALSGEQKVETDRIRDDSAIDSKAGVHDLEQESRKERIAKYKEERKKQLSTIQKMFAEGDAAEMPSLFSKTSKDEPSPVTRSKSLKVDVDRRPVSPTVTRSKSLKVERDIPDRGLSSSPTIMSELAKNTSLRLAELGSQPRHSPDVYDASNQKYDPEKIVDKIHAFKTLKICQNAKRDTTEEAFNKLALRESGESDSSLDRSRPSSYAGRPLLAERVMEAPQRSSELAPSRERIRSSSRESETQDNNRLTVNKYNYPERGREGNVSDSSDSSLKNKSKTYPDRENRLAKFKDKEQTFEFGTVFQKKEKPVEKHVSEVLEEETFNESETEKVIREKDNDVERSDSINRVRRRLPSLEDVLGTNIVDRDKEDIIKHLHSEQNTVKETGIEESKPKQPDVIRSHADLKARIQSPMDYAKIKFQENERNSMSVDPAHFEIGTVYDGSKKHKSQKSFTSKPRPVSAHVPLTSMEEMLGVTQKDDKGIYMRAPEYDIDKVTSESELSQSDMEVCQLYKKSQLPSVISKTNKKETVDAYKPVISQLKAKQGTDATSINDNLDKTETASHEYQPSISTTREQLKTQEMQPSIADRHTLEISQPAKPTQQTSQIPRRDIKQGLDSKTTFDSDRSPESLDGKLPESRPLSSPKLNVQKGDMHKMAEQRFSKPNQVGNEAFAFGTVYGSYKPPVSKPVSSSQSSSFEKEKSIEDNTNTSASKFVVEEKSTSELGFRKVEKSGPEKANLEFVKKSSIGSSQKSFESETSSLSDRVDFSPARSKKDTEFPFETKPQSPAVTAAKKETESPLSPKSPLKSFAEPYIITTANLVSPVAKEPEGIISPTEVKAMKIENISTSKVMKQKPLEETPSPQRSATESSVASRVSKQSSKEDEPGTQTHSVLEKKPSVEEKERPTTERQTSFTSFELKTKSKEEKTAKEDSPKKEVVSETKQVRKDSVDKARQPVMTAKRQTPERKTSVASVELKSPTSSEPKHSEQGVKHESVAVAKALPKQSSVDKSKEFGKSESIFLAKQGSLNEEKIEENVKKDTNVSKTATQKSSVEATKSKVKEEKVVQETKMSDFERMQSKFLETSKDTKEKVKEPSRITVDRSKFENQNEIGKESKILDNNKKDSDNKKGSVMSSAPKSIPVFGEGKIIPDKPKPVLKPLESVKPESKLKETKSEKTAVTNTEVKTDKISNEKVKSREIERKSAEQKSQAKQEKEEIKPAPVRRERKKKAEKVIESEIKETKKIETTVRKSELITKVGEKVTSKETERKHGTVKVEETEEPKQEKSKFEIMKEKVAQQVLVKPTPVEPEEEQPVHEKPKSMFERMREKVAQQVLVKPTPIEPEEDEPIKFNKPKPVVEKSKPVEKVKQDRPKSVKSKSKMKVVDTSLDDILSKNAEYLTDVEPPESGRGRADGKKSRPQSIHEHPAKAKRSFRKKVSSRRSKSEDRSHFKVSDDSDT